MTALSTHVTLRQAACAARDQLASRVDLRATASQDAEHLLLHTLRLPRTTLRAYPERPLSAYEQTAFAAAIARRLLGEPVQYITGVQEFYGLPLAVTPAVLIPRPETELLVEAVLARLPHDSHPLASSLRLADVGTGSGAIAIAIASRLPAAEITCIDLSSEALAIARRNAATHVVSNRLHFVEGDLLAVLPPGTAPFQAIFSNPPYIPETDRASLHPQVRDFEPSAALFAGPTGLSIYERLIPQAREHLVSSGLLALEIGFGQRSAVERLLKSWDAVEFLNDLQDIPRVALARRP